ncbi:unannotated protein [freshwater metagenome]|uniref:Unannotated protein n=1 Tax=freshwater metagenome TaxID=449393 RepID=A0A6J6MK96_9ZZZZ
MKAMPPQTPENKKVDSLTSGLGWPEAPSTDDVSRETTSKPSGLGWPE